MRASSALKRSGPPMRYASTACSINKVLISADHELIAMVHGDRDAMQVSASSKGSG